MAQLGMVHLMVVVALLVLCPPLAAAGAVQARFDLAMPTGGPFPSDAFTVPDASQRTGRRLSLPEPDCAVRPSDCADVAVLNTLDGFNVQPRLSIPFTGAIDPATVTSATVFLVDLGDVTVSGPEVAPGRRSTVIGINQAVWDPATSTLHVESDTLLDQHTRYALVVTRGVRDAAGDPVEASPDFQRFRHTVRDDYKKALLDGLQGARLVGIPEDDVAALAVFTTQSVAAVLEKIRDQIKAGVPAPARFDLGAGGVRTVFPAASVRTIGFARQTVNAPPGFTPGAVPLGGLATVPGAVGTLAFGSYRAPTYITPERVLPPLGTETGAPVVQGEEEIYFNLTVPAGTPPPGGWPVMIFGHGGNGTKNGAGLYLIAAKMAASGLAVIEINVVGHGGGPLGTLTVTRTDGSTVTFPAGGRGVDLNGDNAIGTSEGLSAIGARALVASTDGIRQTVVDLMQLVRVIEVGLDVDGDGVPDLDGSRISYFGQSLGGNYGLLLHALDPSVRASVINVAGGSFVDLLRLGTGRATVAQQLAARTPSLINGPGLTFSENIPLRGLPPVVNAVAGAMDIQAVIDRTEWVSQTSNPAAWAPHLRRAPLAGTTIRPVILQAAKGDQTAPNPTNTAIIRAGDLADLTTFYRHDLAVADNPARPRNPHLFPFLTTDATMLAISLGTQDQVAGFAASDGHVVLHPTPEQYFEVPIVPPLPETLAFIP